MWNEYAREIEMARIISYMDEMKDTPPFEYTKGRIPNDIAPKQSIRIRDTSIVIGLKEDKLEGAAMPWGWKGPRGKPVFSFVSEGRIFPNSERVLIPATGFYEYTAPKNAKVKLKDQHLFTLRGHEWFWIAGIVKQECFTMLTTEPGPDILPYHDRQICVLHPEAGMDWLRLSKPEKELLKAPPKGSLAVKTLRENGKSVG